jgi:hypothetical protein
MGKTNFVPIFIILIFLSANQSVCANLKENSDVVNGIIPRKIDVDRQVCFNLIAFIFIFGLNLSKTFNQWNFIER